MHGLSFKEYLKIVVIVIASQEKHRMAGGGEGRETDFSLFTLS